MRTVRIALAGLGGVGQAVAALLQARRERYRAIHGADVRLVAACGSRGGLHDDNGLAPEHLTALQPGLTGPVFILASGADVLIEAGPSDFRTGGPALGYIRAGLGRGMDVIAISKGALVHDGPGLRALAAASSTMLKVSGATAAALPTIDLLDYNLKGCRVLHIEGILNATSNYLLDAMATRGMSFHDALTEARAAGFAEQDPRNDVEGWDTACKLVILANFGLNLDLSIDAVRVSGIQVLTVEQVRRWQDLGMVPKLVGRLTVDSATIAAEVGVRTYPLSDPFAHVSGKNKAIRIATDVMGEVMTSGCGSEPVATAAAALKDLEHILAARALQNPGESG